MQPAAPRWRTRRRGGCRRPCGAAPSAPSPSAGAAATRPLRLAAPARGEALLHHLQLAALGPAPAEPARAAGAGHLERSCQRTGQSECARRVAGSARCRDSLRPRQHSAYTRACQREAGRARLGGHRQSRRAGRVTPPRLLCRPDERPAADAPHRGAARRLQRSGERAPVKLRGARLDLESGPLVRLLVPAAWHVQHACDSGPCCPPAGQLPPLRMRMACLLGPWCMQH